MIGRRIADECHGATDQASSAQQHAGTKPGNVTCHLMTCHVLPRDVSRVTHVFRLQGAAARGAAGGGAGQVAAVQLAARGGVGPGQLILDTDDGDHCAELTAPPPPAATARPRTPGRCGACPSRSWRGRGRPAASPRAPRPPATPPAPTRPPWQSS